MILERLKKYEQDVRYQEPASDGEPEFSYRVGSIPILISAPHGAVHTRYGKPKEEDEFSAGLAQLFGEMTGAHVLYARRKSDVDPNFDEGVPYKRYLTEIMRKQNIEFVLDLHGASERNTFGIELGTANGKSCSPELVELIVNSLSEYGFEIDHTDHRQRLAINEKFAGEGSESIETVTRYVWKKLGKPVVQIEVNGYLRVPERRSDATSAATPFRGDPALIETAVHAFADLIHRINDHFGHENLSQ